MEKNRLEIKPSLRNTAQFRKQDMKEKNDDQKDSVFSQEYT